MAFRFFIVPRSKSRQTDSAEPQPTRSL